MLMKKKEVRFVQPSEPTGKKPSAGRMETYRIELKAVMEEERRYKQVKATVFRWAMGICSSAMRHKVESQKEYDKWEDDDDLMALMGRMRDLVYCTDEGVTSYLSSCI